MGYSMGALHTLFIAANERTNPPPANFATTRQLPLLKFDRYVAINTPVRLLNGVRQKAG